LLKIALHTTRQIATERWDHLNSREQAAFPAPWLRDHKFWPSVARIDNVTAIEICFAPACRSRISFQISNSRFVPPQLRYRVLRATNLTALSRQVSPRP